MFPIHSHFQAVKLVASLLLLLAVAVLASKDASGKPVDGVASTPSKPPPPPQLHPSGPSKPPTTVTKKASSHGKREVASAYGLPHYQPSHHRYSFAGHAQPLGEFYAPPATSHGSYSYSIPQHSPFPPMHGSFGGHKLYLGPAPSLTTSYKYTPASSHAFFAPAVGQGHQFAGGFGGPEPTHFKYGSSFGSKELSDLLKQLHSVGPLTIKAIPASYAYGSPFPEHDAGHPSPSVVLDSSAFHLKPMPLKFHPEVASFAHGVSLPQAAALTAPAGPTSTSSTYGHLAHSLGHEPSYASGVKGLRHYSSSPNVPANDLYSGNKYISTLNLHQPTTATMVSPLHTSVHSTVGGGGAGSGSAHQKPFKPSTYLGSTHETISAPSTSHTGAYLAPSLQYLPPVSKGAPFPPKLSYDSPAKHGYLPPAPPSTNAYLPPPPKPAHGYLPPVPSSNYLPLSASSAPSGSHEDTGRKPSGHQQHHHHIHHGSEQSSESLEYSGATAAVPTPTAVTASHHWKH